MIITQIENKDKVLMENAFFTDDNENIELSVCGWYGLTYFEITRDRDFISFDKDKFLKLYDLMTAMKNEIDRLEDL